MSVRRNIIANYLGRGWTALLSFVFVPLYIKFLGAEAYGLIGIYLSLLGLLAVMDLGLSTTLNRMLAQQAVSETNQSGHLVVTFEIVYWSIGLAIGAAIFMIAPWLTAHWLNQKGLSPEIVTNTIRLMGGVIVFQWPVSLYSGGLMGLQRQALLNAIRSLAATVQSVGSILILWLVAPTIQAFFVWQLLAGALQVILLNKCLKQSLPKTMHKPKFDLKWLLHSWHFSVGTFGITILGTILTQVDKIILSKYLSLTAFGYYTLASTICSALSSLSAPIFSAAFPRFTQLYAEGDNKRLAELYHKTSRLMALSMVPIGVTLAFFPSAILFLWLHNAGMVDNVSPILRVMVIGTAANSIMTLPLALQLASGWTKLSFYKNIIAVILFVPMLSVLISVYGALGGAISWTILNLCYVAFEPLVMHRRILQSEMMKWYVADLGAIVLTALVVGGTVWHFSRQLAHDPLPFILSLVTTWIISGSFLWPRAGNLFRTDTTH